MPKARNLPEFRRGIPDVAAPRRPLGTTGVAISPIGLGCMGMSDFYGSADDAKSTALLHHALDVGMNFFDTADAYGPWTNEELLGAALAGRRDEAVIATKFAIVRDESGSILGINGKPEYVHACCDGSLRRLGVDTIDLYYQHRVDPEIPIEETVGAMADFVGENFHKNLGLVEAVGAIASDKDVTPAQLALAWLLHQGEHVVTIPGTTKQHRFDENLAANDVTLTADELARLDEMLPVGAAVGARY